MSHVPFPFPSANPDLKQKTMQIDEIMPYVYLTSTFGATPEAIYQKNVKIVINAARELPEQKLPGVQHVKLHVYDHKNEDLSVYFDWAADVIHSYSSQSYVVLVHCVMGISRSTSLVLCYLMKYHYMTLKESLDFVRAKRQIIRPNSGFMKQLIAYEKKIFVEVHGQNAAQVSQQQQEHQHQLQLQSQRQQQKPQRVKIIRNTTSNNNNKNNINNQIISSMSSDNISVNMNDNGRVSGTGYVRNVSQPNLAINNTNNTKITTNTTSSPHYEPYYYQQNFSQQQPQQQQPQPQLQQQQQQQRQQKQQQQPQPANIQPQLSQSSSSVALSHHQQQQKAYDEYMARYYPSHTTSSNNRTSVVSQASTQQFQPEFSYQQQQQPVQQQQQQQPIYSNYYGSSQPQSTW